MAKNKNYSIRFWENWWEAVEEMDDQELGKTLRIIFDYSFRDKKPEKLNPMQKMFFNLCKPILDSNREAYDNGNLGGRPKKTTSKTSAEKGGKKGGFNPNDNHVGNPTENPLENPIENHTVTVTDTVTVTGTEKDTDTDTETEKENSGFLSQNSLIGEIVDIYNLTTGSGLGELPFEVRRYHENMGGRYSVDQYKKMISYWDEKLKNEKNAEWYNRCIKPSWLLGREHFEENMAEALRSRTTIKQTEGYSDDDLDEYDKNAIDYWNC